MKGSGGEGKWEGTRGGGGKGKIGGWREISRKQKFHEFQYCNLFLSEQFCCI